MFLNIDVFFPIKNCQRLQVLEQSEIHPIRIEFLEALGEGAFGKVHKARLKDSLDLFANDEKFFGRKKQSKTVAVKELHGMMELCYVNVFMFACFSFTTY